MAHVAEGININKKIVVQISIFIDQNTPNNIWLQNFKLKMLAVIQKSKKP